MADKRDFYEVLGVDRNADDAALKRAYRKLAKKYHPDSHPGDKAAEEKFKEASEAYAILSDPDKRRQYDQFGMGAFEGNGAGGAADLISPVWTLEISSEISSAALGALAASADPPPSAVPIRGRMFTRLSASASKRQSSAWSRNWI